MRESGYYAPGTEFDPRAPWNEKEPEEIEKDCEVWTAVKKTMPVPTQCYEPCEPWEEPDLSGVDWSDEFATRCRDIPEILRDLCELVKKYAPQQMTRREARYLRELLDDAEGWETDEIHVEEV